MLPAAVYESSSCTTLVSGLGILFHFPHFPRKTIMRYHVCGITTHVVSHYGFNLYFSN